MGCTPAAICATVFISVIAIIAFIIIAIEDHYYKYSSDSYDGVGGSGVGRGRYRGSRLGSGGWGRGGGFGRGCFFENTTVWTKSETQDDTMAIRVFVKDLKEGDLVGTLDLSKRKPKKYQFMWTRSTDVTSHAGNWTAHTFAFSNEQYLTTTSPHLMIIWRNEMLYFVRAENIQIGDEMIVNGIKSQIVNIKNHMIKRKISIETEDGTIQVNGVLASGLCDNNPEVVNRIVKYKPFIKEYKTRHFGVKYDNMCMDEVAWKNAYMINNGYLE